MIKHRSTAKFNENLLGVVRVNVSFPWRALEF